MADRPPARAVSPVSLDVHADLRIDDPWAGTMTVTVRDGRGTVVVPRTALRYSSLGALPRDRARWSAGLQRALGALGLTINVMCEGRTIASISAASDGNWLGRLLRLGPVQVHGLGVLAAWALPAPGASRG